MPGGWNGKLLEVDLTTGESHVRPLPEDVASAYLGGRGLGVRLLWDMLGPGVDPLGPHNVIMFMTGPMTATGFPTTNRFSVVTKSPLTGTVLDSSSGGFWGMRLKRTGFDGLIVKGRAERPVYLEVGPSGVAIKDASHVWGKTVSETATALGQGGERNVLCIGPAGENLVRIAAVMNDKTRAAGRGGPGAVMGSKKLKAIVVEGGEKPRIEDREGLKFVQYESSKMLRANPITSTAYPLFGTAAVVHVVNAVGAFPTRNFQQTEFEHADAISGETLADTLLVKRTACWACPIGCTRVTRTKGGSGEGPEYETIWAFGADCGISDLEAIADANYLCGELGLDTMSAGATIACAMEMTERGIVKSDLRFGDAGALIPTLKAMAYRRGLGDDLAEGSRRFAEKYGAPQYSMTVKSLEMPAYDPRGMQGQGLLYVTSNRGACHMRGNMLGPEVLGLPKMVDRFQVYGKAGLVIVHQDASAGVDSLPICRFANVAIGEDFLTRALNAVTGFDYATGDLLLIGERVWNLERLFNLREGFTAKDDALPERLLREPATGASAGWVSHVPEMLPEYYRFRGWDENGVPKKEKLEQLGLLELVGQTV